MLLHQVQIMMLIKEEKKHSEQINGMIQDIKTETNGLKMTIWFIK